MLTGCGAAELRERRAALSVCIPPGITMASDELAWISRRSRPPVLAAVRAGATRDRRCRVAAQPALRHRPTVENLASPDSCARHRQVVRSTAPLPRREIVAAAPAL